MAETVFTQEQWAKFVSGPLFRKKQHYHVRSSEGDACRECGRDLRDDIHIRGEVKLEDFTNGDAARKVE